MMAEGTGRGAIEYLASKEKYWGVILKMVMTDGKCGHFSTGEPG